MPENNSYVKWQIFAWTVGVLTTLIGGSYAYGKSIEIKTIQTDVANQNNRVDIAILKAQYQNIENGIKEIKDILKTR